MYEIYVSLICVSFQERGILRFKRLLRIISELWMDYSIHKKLTGFSLADSIAHFVSSISS